MAVPIDILKQYWGFDSFREKQGEIIQSVLEEKDTLALLPTGGGKSICFQVPGLVLEGMTLVVSPLIALMRDQVDQLRKRGILASAIYSGMPHREIDIVLDNCVNGKVKFLYVSPERLKTEIFIERIKRSNVSLIAIDEAHCISQWGYDFRPSYLDISELFELLPEAKKIALTATATKEVKEDICEKLNLREPTIFQKSFARSNLSYSAFELENKGPKLLEILKNVPGSSIIYVRSRKETESVAKFLYQNSISSDFYHAGLEAKQRTKKQEDWISGKRRVMVATNAFGMGIDKSNVRTVIHLDVPDSLEAYYQEAGRAGRDEKKAFVVMIYSQTDLYNLKKGLETRNPSLEYLQKIYQALANYYKLAIGSSELQSYDFDVSEFCYQYNFHGLEVHHAIKKLQEMGLLLLNESMGKSSSLKIAVTAEELYKFDISNAAYEPIIKSILRLHGGSLYTGFQNISEFEIAKLAQMGKSEVVKKLSYLHDIGMVVYDPIKSKPQLTYLLPRLDVSGIGKYFKEVSSRYELISKKVEKVIHYTQNDQTCRTRIIQEYFNEAAYLNCGVCDICLKSKKEKRLSEGMEDAQKRILSHLKLGSMEIDKLKEELEIADDFLFTETIRMLLDNKQLSLVGTELSITD